MPTNTNPRSLLDYALIQCAAESYLHQADIFGGARPLGEVLRYGSNNGALKADGSILSGATRMTQTQIEYFQANFQLVAHVPNDASGMSMTIVRDNRTMEYIVSFRSTEFAFEAVGGDWLRDGLAGADGEIQRYGFALAQISAMQNAWQQLVAGNQWTVDPLTGTGSWTAAPQASLVAQFAAHMDQGGQVVATGYSLGAHLSTAFSLMNSDDVSHVYNYNAAGLGGVEGLDGKPRPLTGLEVYFLMRDYELLMAWDGTLANIPAHARFDEIREWFGVPADATSMANPAWVRVQALRAAAEQPRSNVSNVYETSLHDLAMAYLCDDYTIGVRSLGVSRAHDSIENWLLGGGSPHDFASSLYEAEFPNIITSVHGEGDFFDPHFVAHSGFHPAPAIQYGIPIEDLPLSRGLGIVALVHDSFRTGDFGETHSITLIIDSLTVMSLLQEIDQTVSYELFRQLMRMSSNRVDEHDFPTLVENVTEAMSITFGQFVLPQLFDDNLYEADALENLVDDLGRLFVADYAPIPPAGRNFGLLSYSDVDARELLHARVEIISQALGAITGPVDVVSLAGLSAATLLTRAQNDIAYRYALVNLQPFAILGGGMDNVYAIHNEDRQLDAESFSAEYLADRASMLRYYLLYTSGAADADDVDTEIGDKPFSDEWSDPAAVGDTRYIDALTSTQFEVVGATEAVHLVAFGSEQANTFEGGAGSDRLYGHGGSDTLVGGGGVDRLEGGSGIDLLDGGDQDDRLYGGDHVDVLIGGAGSDHLEGGSESDEYRYVASDFAIAADVDHISDSGGFITFEGQPIDASGVREVAEGHYETNDGLFSLIKVPEGLAITYLATGSRIIVNGWVNGRVGLSLPGVELPPASGAVVQWSADPSPELTAANEHIYGTGAGDAFDALGGDDWVEAGLGRDAISGGAGDDRLFANVWRDPSLGELSTGDAAGDFLSGGDGNDLIVGDDGDDALLGGNGNDEIHGGAGHDNIWSDSNGSVGLDWSVERGESFQAVINGAIQFGPGYANGADTVYGGGGDDWIVVANGNDYADGGADNDVIIGGSGSDVLLGGDGNDLIDGQYGNLMGIADELPDGNDYIDGGAGDDTMFGDLGNDRIFGGAGDDQLDGGKGNDSLDGGGDDDLLIAGEGNDTVLGGAGNDELQGDGLYAGEAEHGADVLRGEGGNDTIFGQGGDDELHGGEGNDTLYGDANHVSTAYHGADDLRGGAGNDLMFGQHGNDTLTGDDGNDQMDGGAGNDVLDGGDGADQLYGGEGDDVLDGGGGNDVLAGGTGADRFLWGAGSGFDVISTAGGTSGQAVLELVGLNLADISIDSFNDELIIRAQSTGEEIRILGYGLGSGSPVTLIQLADGTELTLENIQQLLFQNQPPGVISGFSAPDLMVGSGGNDIIVGAGGNDDISGGGGSDSLYGGTGHDLVSGGAGDDTLEGNDGNDGLRGGGGSDLLYGGAGNDTFIYAAGDGADTIIFSDGADVIELEGSWTPSQIAFQRAGDDLYIAFTDAPGSIRVRDHFAAGNGVGQVNLAGGQVITAAQILALVGPGGSANTQTGGTGNDLFQVDHPSDVVIEQANGGTDTIETSVAYSLPAHVENLTLTGTYGFSISGNALNNILRGNSGHNSIYGGGGLDVAYGGAGDDNYYGIYTINEAQGEGFDTAYIDRDGGGMQLMTGVERLVVQTTESDSTGTNTYSGNSENNIIDVLSSPIHVMINGGAGADTMTYMGTSNVTFVIDNIGDTYFGASGSNVVTVLGQISGQFVLADFVDRFETGITDAVQVVGNALDNRFDFTQYSQAANTAAGGLGNDTYFIGTSVTVIEAAGEGTDSVEFWGLNGHLQLTNHVENATLLSQSQNSSVTGNMQDNVLTGNAGNNALAGGGGTDTLLGGGGNDVLDGGAGADTMVGGVGDDIYHVDALTDVVSESANAGNDQVLAHVDHTLGANVERLSLVGAAVAGTGNSVANVIVGNQLANVLSGLEGNDQLEGGAGNDDYVYRLGDGSDTIREISGTGGGSDTLRLGPGITTSMVSLVVVGLSTVEVRVGGSVINITSTDASGVSGVEFIEFDDGTVWDVAALTVPNNYPYQQVSDLLIAREGQPFSYTLPANLFFDESPGTLELELGTLPAWMSYNPATRTLSGTPTTAHNGRIEIEITATDDAGQQTIGMLTSFVVNVVQGTSGANTLNGTSRGDAIYGLDGNDTINGGAGADLLVGGLGNDTYVITTADAFILESENEGTDTVSANVSVAYLAEHVENLTLTGSAALNARGNYDANIITGNSGNNTLEGDDGNDVIDGGAGNDTMLGGTGDDVFTVTEAGDIVSEFQDEGVDTVRAGRTYTLTAHVENLELTGTAGNAGTGNGLANRLTGNSGANTLSGQDGDDELFGMGGTDTLNGGNGADTLNGGVANDTLTGGSGHDVYQMARGYGVDTVVENGSATSNTDVARFLTGVAYDQLWFRHPSGSNNLEITIIGTGDKLVIRDWYLGSNYRVESIRTVDGSRFLLAADVEALVTAMAGMTMPPSGQSTLTTAQRNQLQATFNSVWQTESAMQSSVDDGADEGVEQDMRLQPINGPTTPPQVGRPEKDSGARTDTLLPIVDGSPDDAADRSDPVTSERMADSPWSTLPHAIPRSIEPLAPIGLFDYDLGGPSWDVQTPGPISLSNTLQGLVPPPLQNSAAMTEVRRLVELMAVSTASDSTSEPAQFERRPPHAWFIEH